MHASTPTWQIQKVKQGATSREAYGLWLYGKIGSAIYSGSSLAAAAAVYNDSLYNDTPNASPSNVSVPISSACLEDGTEVLMDQEQGNVLNEQGVATFIRSGDFVVWGNETCCYPKNTDPRTLSFVSAASLTTPGPALFWTT